MPGLANSRSIRLLKKSLSPFENDTIMLGGLSCSQTIVAHHSSGPDLGLRPYLQPLTVSGARFLSPRDGVIHPP
jgi:hypothetical protein